MRVIYQRIHDKLYVSTCGWYLLTCEKYGCWSSHKKQPDGKWALQSGLFKKDWFINPQAERKARNKSSNLIEGLT